MVLEVFGLVCVWVCVCMSRGWLAGEGAELMAATGPGCYGVFVKMTSSCSIVNAVLLHLLSSSSYSLSHCVCLSTTQSQCFTLQMRLNLPS